MDNSNIFASLNSIYEQIYKSQSSCDNYIHSIPSSIWNNIDNSTKNTIISNILDKELKINYVYDELSELLFYKLIPSLMLSKKPHKRKKDGSTYTNYSMTYNLLNGNISFYDNNNVFVGNEVLIELFEHLYVKTTYIKIITKASSPIDAYNYIAQCVKNKLIDIINKKNKIIQLETSIEQQNVLDNGNTIETEYPSPTNIEREICDPFLIEAAKNELIHKTIDVLSKHPDRLLVYLNNIVGDNTVNLLHTIKNSGYNNALKIIIKKAASIGINLTYLENAELHFKISPENLNRQHIDTWGNRYRHDIKFQAVVDDFKKMYI